MIRLLIYLLLFYVGFRVVKSLIGPGPSGTKTVFGNRAGKIDDVMIQDPVCKVYFPKREGVHLSFKGKDLYFCSSDCRENYLKDQTKKTEQ